ncbi:MAG: AmmeMemoRadiSam system protein B [Planctomycetes bacterium]|nr:AmmeMemoRadiSam system protein B [Planctomycetota bacterium]
MEASDQTRPDTLDDRPAVRAVDVQRTDGGIALTDRLGISEPTLVPDELLPIVGRCDGTRSLAEIAREASRQLRRKVPLALVRDLVRQLDDRLLLVGPRFETALQAAAAAFLAAPDRPARHAGSAGCPAEPAALRRALDELLGRAASTDGPPVRGLVAPHIDLARGAAGYRAAYRRLLAAPAADLYVVFGTGHAGPSTPVTGLRLDWSTPLGTAATDRAFVDAVHAEFGAPDPASVLMHRDEHSLEFQVLFLQHLHELRGDPAPRIAGFLCGALPAAAGDPLREPWCRALLAAFRGAERATPGRVCYLAGADLAHIGPVFGDATAVGDDRLAALDTADRGYLALLERGEPGAFHAAIEAAGNGDRICSAPAITLCGALAGGRGELLHYGQARAEDGSQTVSFAALAFGAPAVTP